MCWPIKDHEISSLPQGGLASLTTNFEGLEIELEKLASFVVALSCKEGVRMTQLEKEKMLAYQVPT